MITVGFSPDSRVLELQNATPLRFVPLDVAAVDRLAGTFASGRVCSLPAPIPSSKTELLRHLDRTASGHQQIGGRRSDPQAHPSVLPVVRLSALPSSALRPVRGQKAPGSRTVSTAFGGADFLLKSGAIPLTVRPGTASAGGSTRPMGHADAGYAAVEGLVGEYVTHHTITEET